jgi:hypothetical protein
MFGLRPTFNRIRDFRNEENQGAADSDPLQSMGGNWKEPRRDSLTSHGRRRIGVRRSLLPLMSQPLPSRYFHAPL